MLGPQWSRSVKSGVTVFASSVGTERNAPQWSRSVKSGVTMLRPAVTPSVELAAMEPLGEERSDTATRYTELSDWFWPQWSRSVKSGVTGPHQVALQPSPAAAMEPLGEERSDLAS